METKEEILEKISTTNETPGYNSMGCSESWYNEYYCVKKCFEPAELEKMTLSEIENLLKLAAFVSSNLY